MSQPALPFGALQDLPASQSQLRGEWQGREFRFSPWAMACAAARPASLLFYIEINVGGTAERGRLAGDGWIWWGCENLEDWLPILPMCFQGKKQESSKREETVMERPSPTGWCRHPMRPRLTISAFVPTTDPELLCWATPDDSVGQPAECPIKDYRSPA
jgi:hypothetical protein